MSIDVLVFLIDPIGLIGLIRRMSGTSLDAGMDLRMDEDEDEEEDHRRRILIRILTPAGRGGTNGLGIATTIGSGSGMFVREGMDMVGLAMRMVVVVVVDGVMGVMSGRDRGRDRGRGRLCGGGTRTTAGKAGKAGTDEVRGGRLPSTGTSTGTAIGTSTDEIGLGCHHHRHFRLRLRRRHRLDEG
jgi:hypothetical protein